MEIVYNYGSTNYSIPLFPRKAKIHNQIADKSRLVLRKPVSS